MVRDVYILSIVETEHTYKVAQRRKSGWGSVSVCHLLE